FPWGRQDASCDRAVFEANAPCEREPQDVGSRSPAGDSEAGCRDMAGNVAEWVADWYGPYSPASKRDPAGPERGVLRVVRGGSFRDPPTALRTTARRGIAPDTRAEALGFRCAYRL